MATITLPLSTPKDRSDAVAAVAAIAGYGPEGVVNGPLTVALPDRRTVYIEETIQQMQERASRSADSS
jgi:hypothetical protein